jgi:chromosome segregation ATPase
MAGAPDSKLHELLKSAARELKATQQELADERDLHEQARKALDGERARSRELQQQVLDAQQALRKAQQTAAAQASDSVTAPIPRNQLNVTTADRVGRGRATHDPNLTLPPVLKPLEDSTNVSRLDPELLELRVRALDEALSEAEAESKLHRQRVAALEAQLEALKEVDRPNTAEPSPALRREADESRARAEVAEAQRTTLETELAEARKASALADEVHAGELAALKEALSLADEQRAIEQASSRAAMAKFAAVNAELATVRETAALTTGLDGQLATSKARILELEQLKSDADGQLEQLVAEAQVAGTRIGELSARVSQLENDLAGLRTRRDELNVELARVENDRKKLTARVTELEGSVQAVRGDEAKARAALEATHQQALAALEGKRAEADGLFQKEKDKLHHTAQRLLEARQKTREVETQLADVQAQLAAAQAKHAQAGVDARAKRDALANEHSQALARERASHEATTASLQVTLAQLEKDLAHATAEWHHTNRQYEQLHREMLVLLDQRDEARRQLESLREK